MGIHLEIPMIAYISGPRTPKTKISRKVSFLMVSIYPISVNIIK